MINCPKCGFNQPEDQFCANCGIDMMRYRPKKKPIWIRLAESRAVHALLLTVFVAIGVLFVKVYYFDREDSATFSTLDANEEKSAPSINSPLRKKSDDPIISPQPKSNEVSLSDTTKPTAIKEATKAIPEVLSAQIIFLEVPLSAVESYLIPNIQAVGSNQIRGGVITQGIDQLLKESREIARETRVMQKKEVVDLYRGSRSSPQNPQEYGFSLQIENTDVIEDQHAVQFSFLSHMPIYTDRKIASVESGEITHATRFPHNGGFFIIGGLPRRTGSDEYPLSNGVFDILSSQRFKTGLSEFVILVMPKP